MPDPRDDSGPSNRWRTWYRFLRCGSVRSPRPEPTLSRADRRGRAARLAGFGGEQDQLTDSDDAAVVIGCPALDIAHLIGQTKTLALHNSLAWSTPDGFSTPSGPGGDCHGIVRPAVRRSAGLRLPLLRPHCHLRLPQRALAARAGRAFFPSGGRRTGRRQGDPEPAHRRLPELGGSLRPQSSAADRKSMEQGPSFRISVPKYATKDPNYRILARQRSRFTHYYFYLRDETLGPMVMRVASFFPFQTTYYLNGHSFIEQELKRAQIGFRETDNPFLAVDDVAALQAAADKFSPQIIRTRLDYWTLILGPKFSTKERKQLNLSRFYAIAQIEYCRNFIFKRNFPIHKLFERSCELGLWRLTADKITEIFGTRLNRRTRGKLATVIDRVEHGHHVFRAYFKNAFLKQYEKFTTFLRNELVSNNLADFRLKKGLDHLDAVRQRFQTI